MLRYDLFDYVYLIMII